MVRYEGQELPAGCRIAVVCNDSIGNFVAVTPLLQMLRSAHRPRRIACFSGPRVREMLDATDLCDEWDALHGPAPRDALAGLWSAEPYDLVVNVEQTPVAKVATACLAGADGFVCGPCAGEEGRGELPFGPSPRGDLWRDRAWASADLARRYPFLQSGWIAEIFCRLAYLEGDIPAYRVPVMDPGAEVPDVLIACSATLEDKLWSGEGWLQLARRLHDNGLSLGLVGAPAREQTRYWRGASVEDRLVAEAGARDLRGAFSLPAVAGALARARAVCSLDNGIMHLACAVGAPTVALFRHGIHHLWAPPAPCLRVVTPGEGRPVASISLGSVVRELEAGLGEQVC
jgi:ADP-heptose:LPS heptosyltransferase